jgi:very-short-patch-repair endonuclease
MIVGANVLFKKQGYLVCTIQALVSINTKGFFMCRKKTTEEFIEQANKIYNFRYTYPEKYKGYNTQINIGCKIHGIFKLFPSNFLRLGCKGCPKCYYESITKSTNIFVKQAINIYGSILHDYSKVKYKTAKIKVEVICGVHGSFFILPTSYLKGNGCPKCSFSKSANKRASSKEEFIGSSKRVHGTKKFGYSRVVYLNGHTKVELECFKHGFFKQTPNSNLVGRGCPRCKNSQGETAVRVYLEKIGIHFKEKQTFSSCKYKRVLPFDFFVPTKNILIEFDGAQHFKPVKKWGGKKAFNQTVLRDGIKTEWALKNGYTLLRIRYNEITRIPEILRKYLRVDRAV